MAEKAEHAGVARRLAINVGVGVALIVVILVVAVGIATGDLAVWLFFGAVLGFALGALTALGQPRRD
ncbi:MAG: hypothetical protein ACE5KQ_07450 [Thermoplasmata archaeon]